MNILNKLNFLFGIFLVLLVGCAKSDDLTNSVENALQQIAQTKSLLSSISTVEAARKSKDKFIEYGEEYKLAMEQISSIDPNDQNSSLALASLMPKVASELQSLMLEISALQARSPEAATVLIPELRRFSR